MFKNLGYKSRNVMKVTLIVLVLALLQSVWHVGDVFIAGGEQSLSIWNSSKTLHDVSSEWYDGGLGTISPFKILRLPMFFVSSSLSNIFPYHIIQEILFGFLILIGGLSVVVLTRYLAKNNFVAEIAGLFYVFNLYSQSQVFARFVPYGIFLWAYLPLFLYLWIRWFESRKLLFLILFLISSVIFSPTYSHPSTFITLWIVACIYSALRMFSRTTATKKKLYFLINSFVGIVLWVVCNSWWIYIFMVLQKSVVANIQDWKYSLATLQGLSRDFPNLQIFLLREKFFFERSNYWGDFYTQWYAYVLSFVVFLVMLYGLFSKFKKKLFLLVLLFLGWFVSKGSNFPLGNVFFSIAFKNIPLVSIFRNSYEKFGVVLLLPYSIFFGFGLFQLYKSKYLKHGKFIALIIFLVSCGVLVWPTWTGDIYSAQAKVVVPRFYEEADNYIESLNIDGRILSLPMIPGEGVRYDWGKTTYAGLEPSDFLFTKPVVSKTISYKYADDKYFELYNDFVEEKPVGKIFDETNIRYLVYHNELDPAYSGATASAQTRRVLKYDPNIKYLKTFGSLDIYEYVGNSRPSYIDISDASIDYSYKKINAGHYIVNIKNAEKPFDIILRTSYNDLWQARIERSILDDHFVAYNYANGWNVRNTGNYNIYIVFKVWPWD